MLRLIPLPLFLLISAPVCAQYNAWDGDQDGIPDAWEVHRDMDENDPRDAWADMDRDGINNLSEYFLGTDPRDPFQPVYLEYDPAQDLAEFIRSAPRNAVLRLPGGDFPLNFSLSREGQPPRLMIQGGWSPDFSERDPCRYPTTLNGNGRGPIFDYQILYGNSAALILESLHMVNAARGAVRFESIRPKVQLLLNDCHIRQGSAERFSAMVWYRDGAYTLISDFIMVNSSITDNRGTGLSLELLGGINNAKVLHSVCTDNRPATGDIVPFVSGYGLSYAAASDSLNQLQILNSIMWRNLPADVRIENRQDKPLSVDSRYNIYGVIHRDPGELSFSTPFDRSQDPLLLQSPDDLLYLDPRSPARSTGLDIGYMPESTPDLGIDFCENSLVSSTSMPALDNHIQIYPNPATEQLLLSFSQIIPNTRLQIRNLLGQTVRSLTTLPGDGAQLRIPLHGLHPGIYYLEILGKDFRRVMPFVKE